MAQSLIWRPCRFQVQDDSISYICGSTIQTLVARQTTRLVQTEVVLQAGIAEAEIVSTFVALVLKWEKPEPYLL